MCAIARSATYIYRALVSPMRTATVNLPANSSLGLSRRLLTARIAQDRAPIGIETIKLVRVIVSVWT
jgi:hypothetical protein